MDVLSETQRAPHPNEAKATGGGDIGLNSVRSTTDPPRLVPVNPAGINNATPMVSMDREMPADLHYLS